MKGKDIFSFCGSSLNEISLYLKYKKAWIHRRKVLDSLCSRSCIVPFGVSLSKDMQRSIEIVILFLIL